MTTLTRRNFLFGATAATATLLAAPAVVRVDALMKLWVPPRPKVVLGVWDQGLIDVVDEYRGQVYYMQNRQFFVYNGSDSLVHMIKPTDAGEWAVTVYPGQRVLVPS